MKKPKTFITIIIMILSINAYSQIGVTSYSIYALGLNTSKEEKISGEIKCFLNGSTIDDAFIELAGMYNFKSSKYHQFSIGLGVGGLGQGEIINSITMPIQLEIYPLQEFKKCSVIFEVTPRYNGDINIRHLWGIKYTF